MANGETFSSMLMSIISSVQTEPELIDLAENLKISPIFKDLTDDEFNDAVNLALETIKISFGESFTIEANEKHKPWFDNYYKDLGVTRWDRYDDYLRNQKNFAPAVMQSMKENLFKITDLLGNPNGDNFKRKGLVVGDVQSGKTANYVGLMNLATDAKYKLVIVLTGTTNTLREQTQIRIDEGLGRGTNSKGVKAIRNVQYKDFGDPVYLTSPEDDFKASSRKNFGLSLESTNTPIIIVTKKNVSSLKNIYNWLEEYSKKQNNTQIDSSVLLIDDEADFASVNTKKEDDNPTAINSRIREIIELFTKSSYIGFTATPYANIFIDPKSEGDMLGQDLFPKDYIYVLGESSEYVGIQSIFSDDEEVAVNKKMLIPLSEDEVSTYLPLKHKKYDMFTTLAPSMIDAINLFLISNVIRDFRGQTASHRSMLVNVSRFTDMHQRIKVVVNEYLEKVKRDIRLYGKLDLNEALTHDSIISLKSSYEKYYNDLEDNYSFDEILHNMNDSIYRIHTGIVNKDSKEVDYLLNEDEGERVIVIGGFALSRGLTLEGLTISYYWRNSVMYDSLLQMGRWFGYRNGYKDLCKIFMERDVISDFKFIAMATQELKEDLEINSKRGLTPMQFGIKVRSGQVGLIITARNKMRTGEKVTTRVNYSKAIIETLTFSVLDDEHNKRNKKIIQYFVEEHKSKITTLLDPSERRANKVKGISDVPKSEIVKLIENYIAEPGSKFDPNLIRHWLLENNDEQLDKWDVVFPTGELKSTDTNFDYGNGIDGNSSLRKVYVFNEEDGIVKRDNSRLGSPNDGRFGLSNPEIELVKSWHKRAPEKTISQIEYFDERLKRKPLLAVYSVIPHTEEESSIKENIDKITKPISLLSIGIPDLGGNSKFVNYTVNKIYQDKGIEREEE
ncbi:Z1 domain-containing protein [Enterococcus faecalis]|uniref:Z1 domain-containing protein n=1 Tax=Enterococcus faecalis TaxID=1351 RepID=UPI003F601477